MHARAAVPAEPPRRALAAGGDVLPAARTAQPVAQLRPADILGTGRRGGPRPAQSRRAVPPRSRLARRHLHLHGGVPARSREGGAPSAGQRRTRGADRHRAAHREDPGRALQDPDRRRERELVTYRGEPRTAGAREPHRDRRTEPRLRSPLRGPGPHRVRAVAGRLPGHGTAAGLSHRTARRALLHPPGQPESLAQLSRPGGRLQWRSTGNMAVRPHPGASADTVAGRRAEQFERQLSHWNRAETFYSPTSAPTLIDGLPTCPSQARSRTGKSS